MGGGAGGARGAPHIEQLKVNPVRSPAIWLTSTCTTDVHGVKSHMSQLTTWCLLCRSVSSKKTPQFALFLVCTHIVSFVPTNRNRGESGGQCAGGGGGAHDALQFHSLLNKPLGVMMEAETADKLAQIDWLIFGTHTRGNSSICCHPRLPSVIFIPARYWKNQAEQEANIT